MHSQETHCPRIKMHCVIQVFVYDWSRCKNAQERAQKEHRMHEYATVFQNNLEDPSIESLHVLCEDVHAESYFRKCAEGHTKAIFVLIGHQPTYEEFMHYVMKTFQNNELVCIMNADIYFRSQKDHELLRKHMKPDTLFALTRHEITDEGHTICSLETCPFTAGGSCDTFVFQMPVKDMCLSNMKFKQNVFGAENVFMKQWKDSGYTIQNPCLSIVTLHLHKGRIHFERYQNILRQDNYVENVRTLLE